MRLVKKINNNVALGSVNLGILGNFSWYATFLGIPIIMPAAGYPSSVIPVTVVLGYLIIAPGAVKAGQKALTCGK